MEELVGDRPAQDQRGRLRRVESCGHGRQAVCSERAIGGVRSDDRHVGHAVSELEAGHAIAELIDFPDDVVARHEGRTAAAPRERWRRITMSVYSMLDASTRTRTSPGPAVGRGASTTSISSGPPERLTRTTRLRGI